MNLRVAILFGGRSAEHEISLNSASNIYNAIDKKKFEPILLGVDKQGNWCFNPGYRSDRIRLTEEDYFAAAKPVFLHNEEGKVAIIERNSQAVLETFHVAFPIIHGTTGEDGTLQGFLKFMNISFVGPDVLGSAVCMDKDITKKILRDSHIPVARSITLNKSGRHAVFFEDVKSELGLPLFIKPCNAGSSVGVSKVIDQTSFEAALQEAFRYDQKILIEEAIEGKEVECAILGNENPKASVVGEIVPTVDFYSYDAKYVSADGAVLKIPAEIEDYVSAEIRETALNAFKAAGCEGMARVDFFLKKDNRFILNEINTLPGFTAISMYPKLWEYTGIPYSDLIAKLIELALERHKRDLQLDTTV